MDQIIVTCDPTYELITEGVTTCIAFVVHGLFFNKKNKQVPFCGLFHWSGFNSTDSALTYNQKMNDVLEHFFDNVRYLLKVDDELTLYLTQLAFIGGEKAEFDENQELVLSGSENEVTYLKRVLKQFDFMDLNLKLYQPVQHYHFLTQGNSSLTIHATLNSWHYIKHDDELSDEVEQDMIYRTGL